MRSLDSPSDEEVAEYVDELLKKRLGLSDTVAAQTSFTNEQSGTTELAKLDDASAKLDEGKTEDAVQKLVDFQSTLTSLATATKPKVDATTSETLTSGAQDVIDCTTAIDTADTADATDTTG